MNDLIDTSGEDDGVSKSDKTDPCENPDAPEQNDNSDGIGNGTDEKSSDKEFKVRQNFLKITFFFYIDTSYLPYTNLYFFKS